MRKIGPIVGALALASIGVTGATVAAADDVGVQFANSHCTILTSPGGAKAEACKFWISESDGAGWFGAYGAKVFGATFVQAREVAQNGVVTVYHLPRPDGTFGYSGLSQVLLRACNSVSNDCGEWW